MVRAAGEARGLVAEAVALGHKGLGIADRNTVAGVVRAWRALRDLHDAGHAKDFRLFTGAHRVDSVFLTKLEEQLLLADVGLLGMPNAGKSTLLGAVSAARPKIADYPFTTLYPQPGVVSVGMNRSFVMVDIPGIIEGAAEGAGLGIRFLKHLQRTRLLLHLVDILPPDEGDIVEHIETINNELNEFSEELAGREQWLLFNKIDLMTDEESDALIDDALERLGWTGRHYRISAAARRNLEPLCKDAMEWVEAHAPVRTAPDYFLLEDAPPAPPVVETDDHDDELDDEE